MESLTSPSSLRRAYSKLVLRVSIEIGNCTGRQGARVLISKVVRLVGHLQGECFVDGSFRPRESEMFDTFVVEHRGIGLRWNRSQCTKWNRFTEFTKEKQRQRVRNPGRRRVSRNTFVQYCSPLPNEKRKMSPV